MIAVRHKRHELFGNFGDETLFEDPAWDMLLDLYAAELEGKRVSVTSLCIAAGVAPTTALRWISKMTEMALLIRHPDLDDRRRAFMTLSPPASEAMRAGTSSGEALRLAAASFSRASRPLSQASAPSPVSASMRRTPDETADSEMILNSAMSPVARTWVPPHSSTE